MLLTVVIVDDDEGFRGLLKAALGGGVELLAEGESGEEAVRLTRELQPDAVLIDMDIPGLDALEATRQIKLASPQTRVVLLTVHDEEAYLSSTGKSGADALLAKRKARAESLACVRDVVGHPRPPWDGRERRGKGLGLAAVWNSSERRRKSDSPRRLAGGLLGDGGQGTEVA